MHLNLPNTRSNGFSLKMMGNRNISLGVEEDFDILRQPAGHDIDPHTDTPSKDSRNSLTKLQILWRSLHKLPKETLRNLGDFPYWRIRCL